MVAFAVTNTYAFGHRVRDLARLTSWHLWGFKFLSVVWLMLVLGLASEFLESGDFLLCLNAPPPPPFPSSMICIHYVCM